MRLMQRLRPTVLMSTPTYALHLAEVARELGIDPAGIGVKFTYHAGEPGPNAVPAMRRQLEEGWGARAGELLGLGEQHAFAPGCPTGEGVHVDESAMFESVAGSDAVCIRDMQRNLSDMQRELARHLVHLAALPEVDARHQELLLSGCARYMAYQREEVLAMAGRILVGN